MVEVFAASLTEFASGFRAWIGRNLGRTERGPLRGTLLYIHGDVMRMYNKKFSLPNTPALHANIRHRPR